MKILIADDEGDMLLKNQAAIEQFADTEVEIKIRSRADSALKMLLEEEFDVLVTDLNFMGNDDLSGMELTERVRETNKDMVIIMVTSDANLERVKEEAREAGVDRLVDKVDLSADKEGPGVFWRNIKEVLAERGKSGQER